MVEVFRTNIQTEKEADFILEELQKAFPDCFINFDLEDCENILRMETEDRTIDAAPFIALVKKHGFAIEILPDEVPQKLNIPFKKSQSPESVLNRF